MKLKLLSLILFFCTTLSFAQDLHDDANAASATNEANATTGWTGLATISSETDNPQNGNFAIRAVSTATNGRTLDYNFTAVVGQEYIIRAWARVGNQVSNPVSAAFAVWTGLSGFATTPIVGDTWSEYVFTVTATSTTPRIRVYTSNFPTRFTAGNTVFLDNVSILPSDSDIEAPSAITDLAASLTTSTGTSLSWTAATDNVGVSNYEVFQDGNSLGLTGGVTSFNVTGLDASTTYNFTVIASDLAGNNSAVSNTESVTTLAVIDIEAPTAISDLSSSSTTSTATSLSWTASTDNIGVTDYEIFQDAVSLGLTGGLTSFNVAGLDANTTYNFTVIARDLAGNNSTISNTESVTTLAGADTEAPTAIADLSSSSTTNTGTSLSWTASIDNIAVTDYEVFQDGTSIGLTGGTTNFNVTGLASETTYNFTVLALDASGNNSLVSNTETITTLAGGGFVDYTSINSNLITVDWNTNNLHVEGDMGIGTPNVLGYRLAVDGAIITEGVTVRLQTNWPDFVFEDDYKLPSLEEMERHINKKGYLMGMPSALLVSEEGIELGEMNAKLLQKIEELTLHTINQEKKIKELQKKDKIFNSLLKRIETLEKELK